MNDLKTYTDSKELPFWNYKRIIQTGDFLYMIKGYESGDEIEADKNILEKKFNGIVEDYVITINTKSEDIVDHGKYLQAQNEIRKLVRIIDILELKIKTNNIRTAFALEIDNSDVKDLLSEVKVEKSEDLEVQKQKLLSKIGKYENDILQIKAKFEKENHTDDAEVDIDEQFMSVCLGLEMHVDEKKISLYQYGLLVKILIKKVESLNKMNHGR